MKTVWVVMCEVCSPCGQYSETHKVSQHDDKSEAQDDCAKLNNECKTSFGVIYVTKEAVVINSELYIKY